MSGLEILTFGCRLNLYESEVMRRAAGAAGLTDAIIVNTCAVTAEAERQARQAIRRARREHPAARIIVTGCAAQIHPDRYAAMPEVDRVIGNREKLATASYAAEAPRRAVGDLALAPTAPPGETAFAVAPAIDGFAGHARAFLQVQQGCDHRCTFCVIPQGRGPSRSLPAGAVAAQIAALVAAGYREVVLTGVDLTAYGADLPGRPGLGQLVRRLLKLAPELPRLRLSSLDPVEIDDELWRLVAEEPRLMPHLHLSLQAGDDLVLTRMKRRHRRADALAACRRARDLRPGIALGADLIAGFPTEDEAMFERSLALVAEAEIDYLHVFPFSPRPGTPAARMPQVPGPAIRERAARLRAAGAAALRRSLFGRLGTSAEVVVERGGTGHTEHYAPVRLIAPAPVRALRRVRLAALEGDALIGEEF